LKNVTRFARIFVAGHSAEIEGMLAPFKVLVLCPMAKRLQRCVGF